MNDLVLPEGALCPRCESGAMEFDASKALEEGGQFVVCNHCHTVFCAICGEPGLTHSSAGVHLSSHKQYICPGCIAGAIVLLDPLLPLPEEAVDQLALALV